jgi:septal ring factor EnvC (AmiA/AmiB activator)
MEKDLRHTLDEAHRERDELKAQLHRAENDVSKHRNEAHNFKRAHELMSILVEHAGTRILELNVDLRRVTDWARTIDEERQVLLTERTAIDDSANADSMQAWNQYWRADAAERSNAAKGTQIAQLTKTNAELSVLLERYQRL